jgi:hypothetical protein
MYKKMLVALFTMVTLSGCVTTESVINTDNMAVVPEVDVYEGNTSRYFVLMGVDGHPVKSDVIKPGPHLIFVHGLMEDSKKPNTLFRSNHALKVRLEAGVTYDIISEIKGDDIGVWLVNAQTREVASSLSVEQFEEKYDPNLERIKIKAKKIDSVKHAKNDRSFKDYARKMLGAPAGSMAGNKAPDRCFNTPVCMG